MAPTKDPDQEEDNLELGPVSKSQSTKARGIKTSGTQQMEVKGMALGDCNSVPIGLDGSKAKPCQARCTGLRKLRLMGSP